MTGVLTGFAIILTVIAAGYLAARKNIIEPGNRLMLNRLAFYVASPALLYTIVAGSDPKILVSPVLIVSAVASVIAAVIYFVFNALFFKQKAAEATLAAAASGYMNVNNIGLPVGMYVIGEITYVPPLILLQVLIFAPLILAVLEAARGSKKGAKLALLRAAKNPIIIASLLGFIAAATNFETPEVILAPLDLIGAAAIPLVLLSFGASFYQQKLIERGPQMKMVLVSSAIKLIAMPLIAYLLAAFVLQLDQQSVFAVTVIGALPTAQNMYNYAATYRRGEMMIRNIIFITTFASLPVIFLISLLLGPT